MFQLSVSNVSIDGLAHLGSRAFGSTVWTKHESRIYVRDRHFKINISKW